MKNALKLFGIITFVAVIGFAMVACGEDDDNPFIGNWSGTLSYESFDEGGNLSGVFDTHMNVTVTETAWTATDPDTSSPMSAGTYTYSGNTATVIQNGETLGTASVSGNKMTVNAFGGTFTLSK